MRGRKNGIIHNERILQDENGSFKEVIKVERIVVEVFPRHH